MVGIKSRPGLRTSLLLALTYFPSRTCPVLNIPSHPFPLTRSPPLGQLQCPSLGLLSSCCMWFAFICHTWSPTVFHFCLPHWDLSAMRVGSWLCPCPVDPSLDSPWHSVYLCRMNRVHFFHLVWPLETFSFAPWGVDGHFCERKNCILNSFAASNNQCSCMNLTYIYFMHYTFITLIALRFYRSLGFTLKTDELISISCFKGARVLL